jgi:hypothetical protein
VTVTSLPFEALSISKGKINIRMSVVEEPHSHQHGTDLLSLISTACAFIDLPESRIVTDQSIVDAHRPHLYTKLRYERIVALDSACNESQSSFWWSR